MTKRKKSNRISTESHVSQQSWSHKAFKMIFCSGGILLCFGIYNVAQEKITQKRYGPTGDRFTFMQALVFMQCAVCMGVAFVVQRSREIASSDNVPRHLYVMCSVSYFLASLFSNMSLEWVNYPTQIIVKSSKPIPIMLSGVLFAHKRYIWRQYVYVLLIVTGMAIFMYKPQKSLKSSGSAAFEFESGEFLLLASLAMDGITGAVQDQIRHFYHTDNWTMMLSMNAISTFCLAIMLMISGEFIQFFRFVGHYPFVLQYMLVIAITGAVGQCFIFKTVTDFGPLTCSIVTTIQKQISLLFSIILFSHPFTAQHIIGTILVYAALMMDAIESRISSESEEAVKELDKKT